jgi:superfamily II DNA or RNA helicase
VTPYRAPLIEPFPYQCEDAVWLAARKQSFLCHPMGVGKTASAIRACDLVGAASILVVCPASTRVQWGREFERFSPLDRPMQICMPGDTPNTSGVVVIFYDQLTKYLDRLMSVRWQCLVIDEAHYLKERYKVGQERLPATVPKLFMDLVVDFQGLITVCDRVIRISGTPAPNQRRRALHSHEVRRPCG